MENIIYVGDLHGSLNVLVKIDEWCVKNNITDVVQVGDFGFRWPGQPCKLHKYFEKRVRQGRPGPQWYTCGGNHENWRLWDRLAAEQNNPDHVDIGAGVLYVQRGATAMIAGKKHLFCGGAESTDVGHRREGVSWWPQETPSAAEFRRFGIALNDEQPDVVVTHDAPLDVELYRVGPTGRIDRAKQPTPRNLTAALDLSDHKPAQWYYGHHHQLRIDQSGETQFFGCGLHGEYMWDSKAYNVQA